MSIKEEGDEVMANGYHPRKSRAMSMGQEPRACVLVPGERRPQPYRAQTTQGGGGQEPQKVQKVPGRTPQPYNLKVTGSTTNVVERGSTTAKVGPVAKVGPTAKVDKGDRPVAGDRPVGSERPVSARDKDRKRPEHPKLGCAPDLSKLSDGAGGGREAPRAEKPAQRPEKRTTKAKKTGEQKADPDAMMKALMGKVELDLGQNLGFK